MKKENGSVLVIFLLVLVLGIIAFLFVVKTDLINKFIQTSSQKTEQTNQVDKKEDDLALVPHIPNFDNLTFKDLPNLVDIRDIYDYQDNKIIVGFNHITEYDPKQKKIVRINNPKVLGSIHQGVLIDNYLYVSSDEYHQGNTTEVPAKYFMPKIDLDSGKIVKIYLKDDSRKFVNLDLLEDGGIIYASSWDGVFKFNPKDESFKYYAPGEVGVGENCIFGIHKVKNIIMADSGCANFIGESTYDPKTDKWIYEDKKDLVYSRPTNRDIKTLGLPTYLYISNLINEKYYLFADKGIYTLKKGEFPKFYKNIIAGIKGYETEPYGNYKLYITRDEKYALLITPNNCGMDPYSICSPLIAEYINLEIGQIKDLLKDNSEYAQLMKEPMDLSNFIFNLHETRINDVEDKIELIDKDNNVIIRFNKKSETLRFGLL